MPETHTPTEDATPVVDWRALRVTVALNGRVRQDYPCSDMIIPPARSVSPRSFSAAMSTAGGRPPR